MSVLRVPDLSDYSFVRFYLQFIKDFNRRIEQRPDEMAKYLGEAIKENKKDIPIK